MSGVIRKSASFDQDLADLGKIRIYGCDTVEAAGTRPLIYREVIVNDSADRYNWTPWWQRKQPNRRRKS